MSEENKTPGVAMPVRIENHAEAVSGPQPERAPITVQVERAADGSIKFVTQSTQGSA